VGEELHTIELAVTRATALTRQLLAYIGQGAHRRENIDLNGLVGAMGELLSVSASRKVAFHTRLQADLPLVEADEGQLQQVVMNLISNAADAMADREGALTLETDALELREPLRDAIGAPLTGKVVRLRVIDTGKGMTPEVRARIFDPFFSTKGPGRGLGLAAVLGILKSHGGALTIDTAPGQGTTFSVYLPQSLAPAKPRPPPQDRPAAESDGSPGLEVLVVDDEVLLRRAASRLLTSMGCTVTEASTGAEAVARVMERPSRFGLVLMDYTMPEMNGAEASRRLAAIAPDVPVVLSSGYADSVPGVLPPGVRLLPKPWDLAALQALVRETKLRPGASTAGPGT
jgi:CheY-like chemotaxis protein